jgi:hypothetical protein
MSVGRFASTLAVGAVVGLGITDLGTAADLAVKARPAPAPASPFVLDVHGFVDVSLRNDYITPRGLLVTNTGLTSQYLMGLVLDVYKDKSGYISDVSFNAGVWNDLWSKQNDPHVGSWNEFDWFVGMDVKFAQSWKFSVQYIEFVPPAHDLITSFPSTERNVNFTLAYDDSGWWGGAPFALNPYVQLWYAASGPSTVVLGKSSTYYVEFGAVPTYDFKTALFGIPFVLSAPSWISVGPEDYWNKQVFIPGTGTSADIMSRFFAGASNFCGPSSNLACGSSSAGVVSTGLTGKWDLGAWIPSRLGKWYAKGGFQYYHIINDALVAAQLFTGIAGGASNVYGTFPQAHRDVVVGFGGVGFNF